ncbi:UDP-N,N'-diacetylbacillosamine 2-epimerase (hydrolyzing) [compost metagenome]
MIYHPVTTSASEIENELNLLFKALLEEKTNIVCVLPNSDAGSSEILSFYEQYLNHPKVFFVSSFEQRDYLSLLKNASVMVGNSSSGIIEAASFYVPVINIGTRQFRRERSANTIDVGTDYSEIKEALARIKEDDFTEMLHVVENVYAKENTSELVVNFLKRLDSFGEALTQKTIYY